MDKEKLDYFRNLLVGQRRQATEDMHADRATAQASNDGVTDVGEESDLDLTKSVAVDLGERRLRLIEEIDDALRRIEDGTYGECERCGKPIPEERLKAIPSARYDAACQAIIEAAHGTEETPTL